MLFIETARLNLLPDNARQLVREVQDRYIDDQAVEDNAHKRVNEIGERLFALDKLFMSGGQITEAQADERRRLQVDHDAASRRYSQIREASNANAQLLANIDNWLSKPSRTVAHMHRPTVELVDVPLPKPRGDLEGLRGEIARLNGERMRIWRAPLSRPNLEAKIRQKVAGMAFRPSILGVDGNRPFDIIFRAENPACYLAWLDPEAMVQRLLADLPPSGDDAMSASAKHKTLEDIDARKLELERMEEALVRATPGAERRPDADVRAVLSIEERPRTAAAA